ncbi:hypothetical protein [Pseudomonas sp. VI4.1]|uniref:hypothetical protein n=1 Tax=Pseudomonas sp. VI4.1 TaxID=1941346 RepID=UPI0009CC1D70|nr:hypothetical protein [Pseudomonas sp. VI4.1]OPK10123.1 hypothetical protein BZ163_11945 [Pseudomonas sp. VI4.1]
MNKIDDAMAELTKAHIKYKLDGSFQRLNQVVSKWPSSLRRSAQLDDFFNCYEPIGVKIETGFTPLKFVSLDALEKAQIGYKWINGDGGKKINQDWNENYVVFMDDLGGGKPIVALTDIENTPIFASYGPVAPFQIADSLAEFLSALAKLIEVVYGEFNIFDISDDDGVNPSFVARLDVEIAPILGERNYQNFFDYFYG